MPLRFGYRINITLISLLGYFGSSYPAYAEPGDEICFPLYRNTGAIPGTAECKFSASTANVGMATYYCTAELPRIERYCGTLPREPLQCDSADVGNPIDSSTGNKHLTEEDYIGMEQFPLHVVRYYNSLPSVKQGGIFGGNWRSTYDRRVAKPSSTTAFVERPNGIISYFRLSANIWTQKGTGRDQLTEIKDANGTTTGWILKTAGNDNVERFDSKGALVSITDRGGLTQSITRSTSSTPTTVAPGPGYIVAVTSSFGREIKFTWTSTGFVNTVTTPTGNVYRYDYDSAGRLSKVSYPPGGAAASVRSYLYAELEHTANIQQKYALTGIIDENGARLATYDYDASGRAIGTQHAMGVDHYAIAYSLNSSQAITSATITDPIGTQRTYRFGNVAGAQVLQAVDQPGGAGCAAASSSRTYDANGNTTSRTGFNDVVTTFTYDTARNLETSRTVASGTSDATTTTTNWHSTFSLPLVIAEPKRKTTFTYDASGNLLTKTIQATTDIDGTQGVNASVVGLPRTWTYAYNSMGQLLSVTGPRTDLVEKTVYRYDTTTGNLLSITNPAGHVTALSNYDADGHVGKIVEPSGVVILMEYSPRGWLVSRQVGSEKTSYDYDEAGQLKTLTSPDGSVVHYRYDDAHRLTDVADDFGNTIHYTLDSAGNRIKEEVKDPDGRLVLQISRQYDALNRMQQIVGGSQ